MNAYKCDMCGDFHLTRHVFTISISSVSLALSTSNHGSLQVCPECMMRIMPADSPIYNAALRCHRKQWAEEHPDKVEKTNDEQLSLLSNKEETNDETVADEG